MKRLNIADTKKAERIIWKEILRSEESRYDHRLHSVLSVCRGLSCYETAAVWGRSPRSVEHWVKGFQDGGLARLRERKRPGRPSTAERVGPGVLNEFLAEAPERFGYKERRWTGRLLSLHLARSHDAVIGIRQGQRLLSRLRPGL